MTWKELVEKGIKLGYTYHKFDDKQECLSKRSTFWNDHNVMITNGYDVVDFKNITYDKMLKLMEGLIE